MIIGYIFCFLIGLAFLCWLFAGLTQKKSPRNEIDVNQAKRKIQNFETDNEKLGYKLSLFENRFKYPYIKTPSLETFNMATFPALNDTVLYNLGGKHKTGRSEFVFEEKLKQKLEEKLIIGGGLYCLQSFKPDIAYINRDKKIFIDIEVDEAYDLRTKTPIHYFDIVEENGKRRINDVNENRDKVFTKNGWTVIRFSEEQILSNTDECVKLVEYVINYWLRVPAHYNLEDSKFIQSKRWTMMEAKSFANEEHRDKIFDSYLQKQPASDPPNTNVTLQDILKGITFVTPDSFFDHRKED